MILNDIHKDTAIKYLDVITNGKYKGLNLTRIDSLDEFLEKQWLDSLYPLSVSNTYKNNIINCGTLLDIGFGGGFPILPLASEFPELKFLGIEARKKKSDAVNDIASILGINNLKTFHLRAEQLLIDVPIVITYKAVGNVEEYLNCLNISSDNVFVYFYKGPNFFEQEKTNLKKINNDWHIFEQNEFTINNNQRNFIGFVKKNVPRGTNQSNNLVKLSSIN